MERPRVTVTLEALALSVGPLRDLLGLTVLPPTAWMVTLCLATVPLVVTRKVRVWRDRATAPQGPTGADPTAVAR